MSDMKQVAEKLAGVEFDLNQTIARRKKTTQVILIGGIIFAVIVALYFSWIHSLVVDLASPKTLLPLARGKVEEMIPTAVKEFEKTLKDMAPNLAMESRRRAEAAIPELRKQLEAEFIRSSKKYIADLEKELDSVLRTGIETHREEYEAFLKNPDDAEARAKFEAAVRSWMDDYLNDPLLQADLQGYANVIRALNHKIQKMATEPEKLNSEEKLELELITAVRELARRKL